MERYKRINLKILLIAVMVLITIVLLASCSCDADTETSGSASLKDKGESTTMENNQGGGSSNNGGNLSASEGGSSMQEVPKVDPMYTQEAQYDGHLTYADDKIAIIDGVKYSVHDLPKGWFYGEVPNGSGNWIVAIKP